VLGDGAGRPKEKKLTSVERKKCRCGLDVVWERKRRSLRFLYPCTSPLYGSEIAGKLFNVTFPPGETAGEDLLFGYTEKDSLGCPPMVRNARSALSASARARAPSRTRARRSRALQAIGNLSPKSARLDYCLKKREGARFDSVQ
jgi:hypothetical protein